MFFTISKHPAHIKDDKGMFSPTALIPFCEFGGKMSNMGVKIDKFEVPFCNSFQAKLIQDQLCYSVDPNKYRRFLHRKDELSLSLYINYNVERQFISNYMNNSNSSIDENSIIVNTIGKLFTQ